MAVTKLTCPECQTVLRPAKPIPPGKAVKCPECGSRFTATEEAPAPDEKKAKPAAAADYARKPKKAAKKPPAKPAAPAAAADDSEEGGVYRFVDAGVKEEEEEDKPEIEYAPDMSIKDLRGPAHMALVHPSNALIAMGGLGFFGWVALIIVYIIPVVFPVDYDEGNKDKPAKPVIGIEHGLAAVNDEKDPSPDYVNKKAPSKLATLFMLDSAGAPLLPPAIFFVYLFLMFLGMVYSGFLCFGAVKIQNLEGYGWGIASCILAIVSVLNFWGLASCTKQLGAFLMGILFDDQRFIWGVMGTVMGIEMLLCTLVGVWTLVTLMSQKVIKGYEYKPE